MVGGDEREFSVMLWPKGKQNNNCAFSGHYIVMGTKCTLHGPTFTDKGSVEEEGQLQIF